MISIREFNIFRNLLTSLKGWINEERWFLHPGNNAYQILNKCWNDAFENSSTSPCCTSHFNIHFVCLSYDWKIMKNAEIYFCLKSLQPNWWIYISFTSSLQSIFPRVEVSNPSISEDDSLRSAPKLHQSILLQSLLIEVITKLRKT